MSSTNDPRFTDRMSLQTKLTTMPKDANIPTQSDVYLSNISKHASGDYGMERAPKRTFGQSSGQQPEQLALEAPPASTAPPASVTGSEYGFGGQSRPATPMNTGDGTALQRGRGYGSNRGRGRGRGGPNDNRGRGGSNSSRGGLPSRDPRPQGGMWIPLRDRSPDAALWTRINTHVRSFEGNLADQPWMQRVRQQAQDIYSEWTKEHAKEGLHLVDLIENWSPCYRMMIDDNFKCFHEDTCAYGHKFLDILMAALLSLLKHPNHHRSHPHGNQNRSIPNKFRVSGKQLCIDWNMRFVTKKSREEPWKHTECFDPATMFQPGWDIPSVKYRIHSVVILEQVLLLGWNRLDTQAQSRFLAAMQAIGYTDQELGWTAPDPDMEALIAPPTEATGAGTTNTAGDAGDVEMSPVAATGNTNDDNNDNTTPGLLPGQRSEPI